MRKTKVKGKENLKNQKAITLIALVITIIVLLILAGVSIATLTGQNGILTQAGNAKAETIISQEKEQVEMAYVSATINKLGENVTASELQSELDRTVGDKETKVTSLDIILYVTFVNTKHNYSVNNGKIDKVDSIPEPEYTGLIITAETEGVSFTKSDGITEGDLNNIEMGDIVIYGDYEYRYNQGCSWYQDPGSPAVYSWYNNNQNGWGVKVLEGWNDSTKTEYGEICGTIFGKPVTNLKNTFYGCSKLEVAPKIPNSVTNLDATFAGCSNLSSISAIPRSVINMNATFSQCTNLSGVIKIDANPTTYNYCFQSTTKPITLTGSSTMLQALADTAKEGNVSVE